MGEPDWIPFQYRDFYDFPRCLAFSASGVWYLLDCPFDEQRDEYPDEFTAYELSEGAVRILNEQDWAALPGSSRRLGRIPVSAVAFDVSKRRYVRSEVLEHLRAGTT